jgi:hypothetical protein
MKSISTRFVNRRMLLFMWTIWLGCMGIILIPGGVITQIRRADERINDLVAASPLGKLCYVCGGPAVQSAKYDDGSVRYFCEQHDPPVRVHVDSAGDKGNKGFNPRFCIIALLVFYGVNTGRAAIHIVRPWRKYIPTLTGATLGLSAVVAIWWWYYSLKR